ncbi:MAG: hypothetical protein BAA02_04880 [Paenibacillaceae bacterium ZCTH02-B3]|nr:MAG: hypothetical protein BAA02_04880 [Paenibacillaceae bacterium ZCTH02-B3]
MNPIVCPWCQNEIWPDEDEMPEYCPVCENELGDYRTVEITLDLDPKEAEGEDGGPDPAGTDGTKAALGGWMSGASASGAAAAGSAPGMAESEALAGGRPAAGADGAKPQAGAAEGRPETGKSGEDALHEELREIGGEEMLMFRAAVDKWLETQAEVPECPSCREYMIEGGSLRIGPEDFRPHTPPKAAQPVLDAPFEVNVYVCPSCFAVHFVLSQEDRAAVIRKGGLFSQSLDLM